MKDLRKKIDGHALIAPNDKWCLMCRQKITCLLLIMCFPTLYNWYRKRGLEIVLFTGKFWSGSYISFLYVPLIAFLRDTWSVNLKFSRSGCIPTLRKYQRFACSWALCISKHNYLKPKCMVLLYCLMEYSKRHKKGLYFIFQHERYCETRQRNLLHQHRLWEWPYYSSSLSSLWNGSPLKWEQKTQEEKGVLNLYFLSHGPLTKHTLERSQFTVGASQT